MSEQTILEAFKDPLWESKKRFIVLQGGGGSGKSYSICQRICYLFLNCDDIIIIVTRTTMPALKTSVYMGDPSITRMLRNWGVPVDDWWHKQNNIIRNPVNNSEIRFIQMDDPEKVKSQSVNYIFMEEATDFTYEAWSQLNTRMRRPNKHGPNQMFIAYNPISIFNWALQTFVVNPSDFIKENALVHFSNFLDNPYLPKDAIMSMLDMARKDEMYYWTYVVGRPGIPIGQIYTNFIFTPKDGIKDTDENGCEYYIKDPWDPEVWKQKPYYGIDWGFVDPMVLVEVREYKGKYYVRNMYYKTQKLTDDLIHYLKDDLHIGGNNILYYDYAEKDRQVELSNAGLCPSPCRKDIHAGIDYLKSCDIIIDDSTKEGLIAKEEANSYAWAKDKDDPNILLDEPDESTPNHFLDALRYAIFTKHLADVEFSTLPLNMGDKETGEKGLTKTDVNRLSSKDAFEMMRKHFVRV